MANVTGFDHAMITVKDIAKAKEFYVEACGLAVIVEGKNRLGVSVGNQSLWISTPRDYVPKEPKFDRNQIGLDHLAFRVAKLADLKEIEKNLKALGFEMEDGGVTDSGHGEKAIYAKDPDGMKVEFKLVEK